MNPAAAISPARRHLLDVTRPFPGEQGLTEAADVDRVLCQGEVPAALQPTVPTREFAHAGRSAVLVGSVIGAATAVSLAVAGSLLTLGILPAVVAGGALTGAAVKWLHHRRHDQGEVRDVDDGRSTGFRMDPSKHDVSPDDLRVVLMSRGQIGDHIGLASAPDLPAAQPGPVDTHREQLQSLARDRRLVADLGQKSAYGHDVLSPVDAPTARRLLGAGREILVVNGDDPQDVREEYHTEARSRDNQVRRNEKNVVVERQFHYGLTAVADATGLDHLDAGRGLPQGMEGIYKNSDTTGVRVSAADSWALARKDGRFIHRDHDAHSQSLDPNLRTEDPVDEPKVPLAHEDVNAGVAFGVAGAILGVGVAALAGLSGGVALIPAFLLGSLGYKKFDQFMRSAQGLPKEG